MHDILVIYTDRTDNLTSSTELAEVKILIILHWRETNVQEYSHICMLSLMRCRLLYIYS